MLEIVVPVAVHAPAELNVVQTGSAKVPVFIAAVGTEAFTVP